MSRTELVRDIAALADPDLNTVDRVLSGFDSSVLDPIRRSDHISLPGLPTLDVTDRPARAGHNPQGATTLNIPATRVPRIRTGAPLKRAANGEGDS